LDLNGKIVSTIADKNLVAGRHKIDWNYSGMNINDGINIIRLRTNNRQLARRYVIINK
jgi:hypothetical protein